MSHSTFKQFLENKDHEDALDRTGFWGARAAGCIFFAQDTHRFLIAHRSDEVQEPGTWGTWGGAIDSGESPKEAVRREATEETGYNGKIDLKPLWVFRHSSGFKYHNFVAIVSNEFKPSLNWESQDADWFSFGEWPKPLHPGLKALINAKHEELKKLSEAD